jgi:hypothetical protein
MTNWYVTFGQRYAQEAHATFGLAHPDGWATIVAETRDDAHACALARLGRQWSDLYAEDQFDPALYPGGELIRWLAGVYPPVAWLNYSGDVRHTLGHPMGPNTLGEYLTVVAARYTAATNKTRLGLAYGLQVPTPAEVAEEAAS